ncbi:hypothetical protein R1sor_001146 [Riccia sorocarpa]|uniref:Uncharacterized protein n=1 Tax=Riccia sorocarpa TaxID=122646 RepID=A0ABD3GZ37_9MARC
MTSTIQLGRLDRRPPLLSLRSSSSVKHKNCFASSVCMAGQTTTRGLRLWQWRSSNGGRIKRNVGNYAMAVDGNSFQFNKSLVHIRFKLIIRNKTYPFFGTGPMRPTMRHVAQGPLRRAASIPSEHTDAVESPSLRAVRDSGVCGMTMELDDQRGT